ncbi:hypothetical protein QOZ80_6AG0551290 [Eleusine coracana subsp. coracana]|nr:hypothetical protein QOZ80_6AG0551290 [Eleusine coracana subsp. coracana]
MKKLEYIRVLVLKFVQDESSAPEIWLSELEITLVLHVTQAQSFISGQLLYFARSWIRALFEITESISVYFGGSSCISKEDGPPSASEFLRLVQATLSKMLPFVDAIVAKGAVVEAADVKLQALILVRDALCTASVQILSFRVETRDILSADLPMAKLDEAIWDTTQEAKIGVMSSWWDTPRSSDIHPVTRSLISYIKVLWANHRSVDPILHDAFLRGHFVPTNVNVRHLTNLTVEMVHCLEEKLTRESKPFLDQSLKFLFLINNFHFILQQLSPWGFSMQELARKINDNGNSYIQVSWAPVLKCLHNPTLHCFTRRSTLPKFESKFQQTYNAQKLWKIPDPGMRKRMREAIVKEVIPDFTEFFKDYTISTPRITPQVMKNMLEELFEG